MAKVQSTAIHYPKKFSKDNYTYSMTSQGQVGTLANSAFHPSGVGK